MTLNFFVGSKNETKINAVKKAFSLYPLLKDAYVEGIEVPEPQTVIPGQPCGLEEIYNGAIFRARKAYDLAHFGVGLESGLMTLPLPDETHPRLNFCVCVICDGKNIYLGQSPGFLIPRNIAGIIQDKKVNLEKAAHISGFTDKKQIGRSEGIIGKLTNGRVTRQDYMEQAVHMSLAHYFNNHLFT